MNASMNMFNKNNANLGGNINIGIGGGSMREILTSVPRFTKEIYTSVETTHRGKNKKPGVMQGQNQTQSIITKSRPKASPAISKNIFS